MKRLLTLLLNCLIYCTVSAQVYYYVPREINPASSPNLSWQEQMFVAYIDGNSNLWLYMIRGYDENCNSLQQLKEVLMQDPNCIPKVFNNSMYHKYEEGREARLISYNDNFYYQRLFPGCYRAYFKQRLTKCTVYRYIDTEVSISLDYNTFVLHSNSANPKYYKRCSISDFKLRRSADDLF